MPIQIHALPLTADVTLNADGSRVLVMPAADDVLVSVQFPPEALDDVVVLLIGTEEDIRELKARQLAKSRLVYPTPTPPKNGPVQ